MSQPSTVTEIAEQYVVDATAADPTLSTYIGAPGHDHELPDLSPEGFEGRAELTRRARSAMTAATPAGEQEQAARDAFLERLGVQLELDDAHAPRWRVNVIASQLHEVRGVFDLMDTASPAGWENVAARLAGVPAALDQYRTTLLAERDAGRVAPRRQVAEVAQQVRSWTGQTEAGDDFFAGLVAPATDAGLPAALVDELGRAAVAAREAYADAGRFLTDEIAPHGPEKEAAGREQYKLDSRYFLGAEVDLEETYAWGWEELHRIESEMADIARGLTPDAPARASGDAASVARSDADALAAAVAALDADPARVIHGAEAFRDWMQELAERAVRELADVHFDIPEQIRPIECMLAPTHDGGIYYTGPSEDFTRPGRMWWAVPEGIERFTPWREVTTVFHEGVPGHHLQVGQTVCRTELLNRWQRSMCWVSGHGEGWALYAERLMDDLGYLSDPADKLGMLDGQGFRAARVIIDLGMHLELEIPRDNPFGFHPGETWTPELGLEFMRQHCRMEDAVIRFEVNRYLGWPGQAPSYKVGERIWLEAREDVRRRQGADFDLKAFHRAALDLGGLGLDPLREALARL